MSDNTEPTQRLPIETKRYTGRDVLVLMGLAGLLALAFWEVVAQGRVFFFRDFALFFYPKRVIAAEAIRHWRIPFWESYGACGEPVLGTYQPAVFYPLSLLYYVFPMPQSFMWFVVLHFFISGAGAYYMMRAWGARRIAAAFASFAWAFSPVFIATLDYVSFMTSLAWLPWCLGFARRVTGGAGFGGFAWLSVSFALAVLAAAPEPVIFIAVVLGCYALWTAVFARRGHRRPAWARAGLIFAAIAVGIVLAGVEFAPFIHTLGYSARQERIIEADAGMWSAAKSDALLLFLPRFYLFADRGGIYWRSQHWLKTVYIGILVPFLVAWTLFAIRRRRNLFFAALAIPFTLMALGPNTPVWRFCYEHLPGVALIRFPVKFYLPAALSMAVLGGFAIDDLMVLARRGENLRPAMLFGAVLAVAALFGTAYELMASFPEAVYEKITPRELIDLGEVGAEQAAECYDATQWSFGRSAGCLAGGAAALLVAFFLTRRRIPRPYGALALAVALFVDVGLYGAHLNPVAGAKIYTDAPSHLVMVPNGQAESRLFMTPTLHRNLQKQRLARIHDLYGLESYLALVKGIRFQSDRDLFDWLDRTSVQRFDNVQQLDAWLREYNSAQFIADIEYEVMKETFYPNVNLLYRVPTVDGFEPLGVKWHHDLTQKMLGGQLPRGRDRVLTRMWGVGVAIESEAPPPGFVYLPLEKPGARAVLADHVIPVDSDAEAQSTVADTPLDVTRRIVLFRSDAQAAVDFLGPAAADAPPDDALPPGGVRLASDDGNRTAWEVDADKRTLLFVCDNFFPNFIAKVDGRPAPLWRANYAYRAVPVEAGRHTVEFVWRPYDFYWGLAMTVAGAAALLMLSRAFARRGTAGADAPAKDGGTA